MLIWGLTCTSLRPRFTTLLIYLRPKKASAPPRASRSRIFGNRRFSPSFWARSRRPTSSLRYPLSPEHPPTNQLQTLLDDSAASRERVTALVAPAAGTIDRSCSLFLHSLWPRTRFHCIAPATRSTILCLVSSMSSVLAYSVGIQPTHRLSS